MNVIPHISLWYGYNLLEGLINLFSFVKKIKINMNTNLRSNVFTALYLVFIPTRFLPTMPAAAHSRSKETFLFQSLQPSNTTYMILNRARCSAAITCQTWLDYIKWKIAIRTLHRPENAHVYQRTKKFCSIDVFSSICRPVSKLPSKR